MKIQHGHQSSLTITDASKPLPLIAHTPVRQRDPHQKLQRRFNWPLFAMAVPGIIVLLIFFYLPMVGVLIAFKNYLPYLGFFGSAWVGLDNFRFLFGTSEAWTITYNTLFMNSLFIVTSTIACLVVALLLNEARESNKTLRVDA
jgi:putative aldouronate transport system permease protein